MALERDGAPPETCGRRRRIFVGVRLAWLTLLAVLLVGCPSTSEGLVVDLQTDFVAGVEFGAIEIDVDGEDVRRRGVASTDSFARPQHVATYSDLPPGVHVVTLSLLRLGAPIATRRAQIELVSSRLVTLIVSRTCGGVVCGAAQTCSGGRCVDPRCVDGSEPSCPPPGCDADEDCSSATSCVTPTCSSSVCLETPSDARCDAGLQCVPGTGCVPRAVTPDAGGLDAGVAACARSSDCSPGQICCDDGLCRSSCAASVCAGQPAGVVCRPAAGPCDRAERCDGTSAACPPDTLASAGETCRVDLGACDARETCTGASPACPPDGFAPAGTACTAGTCDGLGLCTTTCVPGAACSTGDPCGVATWDCDPPRCVTRSPAAADTVCRVAMGPCDRAEICGGATTCPPDTLLTSGVCRDARGACDVAETCNGASAACPPDAFDTGSLCRDDAGACDNREHCDGTGPDCPPDEIAGLLRVCRASAGPCDLAESCDGRSAQCPPDLFAPSTAVCRPATDACDRDDHCTGGAAGCPGDEVAPAGTVCRAEIGDCGREEQCDGVTASCPPDEHQPGGTLCRGEAGQCDVEERCTGTSSECPFDAFRPDGSSCDQRCGVETCDRGYCVGGGDCGGSTPFCNCDNVCYDVDTPFCI